MIKQFGASWQTCRAAAATSDFSQLSSRLTELKEIAAQACSGTVLPEDWATVVEFWLEIGDFTTASTIARRAVADGLAPVDAPAILNLLHGFAARHAAELATLREFSASPSQAGISLTAGLSVITWLRLFNPGGPAPYDAKRICMIVMDHALSAAKARGLSTAIYPEFLSPTPIRAPTDGKVISFHSCGASPGVHHVKPADIPGSVIIDPSGYSGWSSLSGSDLADIHLPPLDEAERHLDLYRRTVIGSNISKYPQHPIREGSELPGDFVFVALQVATDRTQALAFVPMLDMLDLVVDRFSGTDIKVVVKRHPKCRDAAVAKRLVELARAEHIILRDDSIHHLIPRCRAVMTVNSGVGSEAMAHLKPIYVFGAADYDAIAHKIRSMSDLIATTNPIALKLSEADQIRFSCYYRTRYLIDIERHDIREIIDRRLFASEP